MLRGVVFDMDGVLINSHPAHRAAWKSFLLSLGKTVSDVELDVILDGGRREEILKHFLGELSPDQVIEYGKRKDDLLRNSGFSLKPMIGVVDLLDRLLESGVRMAIATSASSRRARGSLKELGLSRYFDTIDTGDDVKVGKPDPAIYRLAATRMEEDPGNLLAMEDAVSGVRAARSAGMRCAGVACNGRAELLRMAGATPIIEDFRTLSVSELEACFR